jgi:hypothetical protein
MYIHILLFCFHDLTKDMDNMVSPYKYWGGGGGGGACNLKRVIYMYIWHTV